MKWIVAAAAAVWLCACGARAPLPPLPKVDAAGFEPAVRAAVEAALQAATQDPAQTAALGETLHAHEQYAAAAVAYRRALAVSASPELAYFLGVVLAADGKYGEAIAPLREAVKAKPESAPIRLKLADSLLASGELDAARAEYQAVLSRDAQSAAAHYGLGRTLTGDEAAQAYRKALDILPQYGAAQFALATAYRRQGKQAEAAALLVNYERDKTVGPAAEDPALEGVLARSVSSTGLLRKAQAMERAGNWPAALAMHEEIVKTNPKLDQAWVNMISLYARTGQPARAEEAYRQAIALAPNRADTFYNFGVFCVQQQRWADAGQAFTKSLALDNQNAEAHHNLGAVVERTGDLTKAAALFRKAIELRPAYRQAHFHLGRIYANQNRYAEAVAELEKSITPVDAESPTYIYALAAVQARAGKKQQAYELLQQAKAEASRFGQQSLLESIDRDLAQIVR